MPGNNLVKDIFNNQLFEKKIKEEVANGLKKNDIKNMDIKGAIRGTGKHFDVKDSDYLNITLDSTESIKISLMSLKRIIAFHIEKDFQNKVSNITSITITGFTPNTVYHKYVDHFYNHEEFTTDASGSYTFNQDILKVHVIYLKESISTYYLTEDGFRDAPVGGSDPDIGTWDAAARIAKLKKDINDVIEILIDNATLDGASTYKIDGTTSGQAIYASGICNFKIVNLKIENCYAGINLYHCNNINIGQNVILNSEQGIVLYNCNSITIKENKSFNNKYGFIVGEINRDSIIENNDISNGVAGVWFIVANNHNVIRNNKIINDLNYKEFYGIYFEQENNNFNTIENNSISISELNFDTGEDIFAVGICLRNLNNSFNTISDNAIKIENNKVKFDYNFPSIYFYGIMMETIMVGKNILKNNKVCIQNNTMFVLSSVSDNRITDIYSGVYIYYNNGYTIENNEIIIKNNAVSVLNYGEVDEQFTGINLAFMNGGGQVKGNSVIIEDNKVSAEGSYTHNELIGINMYGMNSGNLVKSNLLYIKGNTMLDMFIIAGVSLLYENGGNIIEENVNSNNEDMGIYLNTSNYGNIIRRNLFLYR